MKIPKYQQFIVLVLALFCIEVTAQTLHQLEPLATNAQSEFQFTPDSSHVLTHIADSASNNFELFSIKIDGPRVPIKLSGDHNVIGFIDNFEQLQMEKISSDGASVIYMALPTNSVDFEFQLFSNRMDGFGTPIAISPVYQTMNKFEFSQDNNHAIILAGDNYENWDFLLTPISGNVAPTDIDISNLPNGQVITHFITIPNSDRVVFVRGDYSTDTYEVIEKSIHGGEPINLGTLNGLPYKLVFSTDNQTIVILGDGVSVAKIGTTNSIQNITEGMFYQIEYSPTDNSVYSRGILNGESIFKLLRYPIGSVTGPETLVQLEESVFLEDFKVSDDGRWVFYTVSPTYDTTALYRVAADGSQPPMKIAPTAAGREVKFFGLTSGSNSLLYIEQDNLSDFNDLYVTDLQSPGVPQKLSTGINAIDIYQGIYISPDDQRVFIRDDYSGGLYSIRIDGTIDPVKLLDRFTFNDKLLMSPNHNYLVVSELIDDNVYPSIHNLWTLDMNADADNDGIVDIDDRFPNGETDFDNDGIADLIDDDDDNDGVLDIDDAFPLDANESADTDSDGIGNNADTDDDNDGVLDIDDAFPLDASESVDTDSDGTGDNADTDDDNDGVLDIDDAFPLDASESADTDSDGVGNNADTDDDNDGQIDADEIVCGSDPLESASLAPDHDNDSSPNCVDTDDDNDGVLDVNDAFPLDANETNDFDSDGIGDNADLDDDNDGQVDADEIACGSNPLSSASLSTDSDGDNRPDCVDDDDDDDGVIDSLDQCPISDYSATLTINSCNTKVSNRVIADGCSLNDLYLQCNDSGQDFSDCANALTGDLLAANHISRKERSAIKKCLR